VTQQVAVRLKPAEIDTLDALVAEGAAPNRSAALRLGVAYLARRRRYDAEQEVLARHAAEGAELYPELAGLDQFGAGQA
jgi:Arc/MetJ-type ribon-helix-helix transcriptional regulator